MGLLYPGGAKTNGESKLNVNCDHDRCNVDWNAETLAPIVTTGVLAIRMVKSSGHCFVEISEKILICDNPRLYFDFYTSPKAIECT